MEKIQAGFKCQDQGKCGVLWEWWRRLGHSDKNKGAEEVTWNERAHIGFKKQYRVVPCMHPPDSSKCGILQNHHALSNPGNWYWHNTITSLQTWLKIHQFLHALILPVKKSVHFKPENFSGAICRACGKKKNSEFKQKLPFFSNTFDSFLLCPGSRGDLTPKSGRDRRQTNREQSIPTSIWVICQSGDEPAVEHCQWHSAIFIS